MAKDIYNNYVIVTTLKDTVMTGMASGEIGKVDLGLIEVVNDNAIALVEKLTCKTQEANYSSRPNCTTNKIFFEIYGLGFP